jgi:hypothetical protein
LDEADHPNGVVRKKQKSSSMPMTGNGISGILRWRKDHPHHFTLRIFFLTRARIVTWMALSSDSLPGYEKS